MSADHDTTYPHNASWVLAGLRAVRLLPVPANEIRLNDVVLLPGKNELSPVIGVFPARGPDCGLYVCTDNGDWARRSARSPVLRAELPPPDPPL
jgi:hypothetical protein